ncbi:hypothetical protein BMETH_2498_0 [methanotrophic bacterial endosymbiont of Bathymodiolus sp.]|nr:hypothetical protein BMETH_2498_0 [methanotrophic bacterial endosymbiont of Bathymodiolus sp.]
MLEIRTSFRLISYWKRLTFYNLMIFLYHSSSSFTKPTQLFNTHISHR